MTQNIEKYTIKMFVPLHCPPANGNWYIAKRKSCILIIDEHGTHLTW